MQNAVTTSEPPRLTMGRLKPLLERADQGDETAVPELRKALQQVPELANAMGGNLAEAAERALVNAIAGENIIFREALYQFMANLRLELALPNSSPLERLIVERVAISWLHSYYADCEYAYARSASFEHRQHLQRQQDLAQHMYLAAIKSLATVRRLALPIRFDVKLAAVLGTNSVAGRSQPASYP